MDQVYWGSYRRGESNTVQLIGSESVSNPDHVRAEAVCWGVGSGWDAYSQRLTNAAGHTLRGWSPDCVPLARAVARIAVSQAGTRTEPQLASPEYIRNTVTRG
jgi:tRNA A37 threonylcarbamoyladenosine modification protein TsaB